MRTSGLKSVLLTGIGVVAVSVSTDASAAPKFKLIYSFCSQANCADGGAPVTGLAADPAGNFYGVTPGGGSNGNGTIYELVKGGKGYTYRLLYSPANCSNEQQSCPDGASPQGPLVVDTSGNLYGIMEVGGPQADGHPASSGVLFKVTPGSNTPYNVLHVFCPDAIQYCSDGGGPQSGLTYAGATSGAPYDGTSALYGATLGEGAYGGGTSYSYTPGTGLNTLHNFCYVDAHHSDCRDGSSPSGAVAVSAAGNLYGANLFAYSKKGDNQYGLLWGAAGNQIIYQFGSCPGYPVCKSGATPSRGVSLDQDSNMLLGATATGGVTGYGAAYGVDIASGKQTFAISFCHKPPNCQADGGRTSSTLILDGAGHAIGTTSGGVDINSAGTLYQVDLATQKLKTLHAFAADGSDGAAPFGGAIKAGSSLFGTTEAGGANGYGVVYQLTP